MPNKAGQAAGLEAQNSRIITGPDPERFYCPHPGCNRSFAELWRLKVHYRAPPDVRGSGKERGHGTELKWCPKCGKDLKPGKHHVGCSAGKSAPRQAAKRQRQQMSTTTDEWVSSDLSDSLEAAVKRQVNKRQITQSEASTVGPTSAVQQHPATAAGVAAQHVQAQRSDSCRLERLKHSLDNNPGELLFTAMANHHSAMPGTADFGLLLPNIKREAVGAADLTFMAGGPNGDNAPVMPAGMAAAAVVPAAQQHGMAAAHPAQPPTGGDAAVPNADVFGGELDWLRAPSPSPFLTGGPPAGLFDGDDADALLRVPSPPPLPPDWEPVARTGLLFDFDQFDPVKRAAVHAAQRAAAAGPTVSAPLMTVTSAMSPHEMANPSDDYIWQILFEGENDPVPKRVTAHLHHHDPSFFDDDPLLDSLLGADLAPHQAQHAQQPVHQRQGVAAAATLAPPSVDCLDAVLAGIHPTPLTDMLTSGPMPVSAAPKQHHTQQPGSTGTASADISPDGSAATPQQAQGSGHGSDVQQVPQMQLNGTYHPLGHGEVLACQPPVGLKIKQESPQGQVAAAPTAQVPPSPLPVQQQHLEVSTGLDVFAGFM